jgi:hypothetical protein
MLRVCRVGSSAVDDASAVAAGAAELAPASEYDEFDVTNFSKQLKK